MQIGSWKHLFCKYVQISTSIISNTYNTEQQPRSNRFTTKKEEPHTQLLITEECYFLWGFGTMYVPCMFGSCMCFMHVVCMYVYVCLRLWMTSWIWDQKHSQQKTTTVRLHHTKKLLHSKGYNQQSGKATYILGKNICTSCIWWGVNLQNIYEPHTTQHKIITHFFKKRA